MIRVYRNVSPTVADNNLGVVTLSGTTRIVSDAASSAWMLWADVPCLPGLHLTGAATVRIVAGYNGMSFRLDFNPQSATNVYLPGAVPGPITPSNTAEARQIPAAEVVCPDQTTHAQAILRLESAGTNRRFILDSIDVRLEAQAADIIAANFDLNLNRTGETSGQSTTLITQGAIGKPAGQITFLADTLLDARALRDIHKAAAVTVADGPFAGLTYWAIGTIRVSAERTVPGKPAKWLVTVPMMEA